MATEDARRLRIGILGCGPIAQAAHFESCAKARNAELYAICDAAPDLLARMRATWEPAKAYDDYAGMLDDPDVEAVIIATSDAFHVQAATMALRAGKHVLCEKPIGVTVEEVETLREVVRETGLTLQVGHMKRFDAGIQAAKTFIDDGIGQLLAMRAWYCDSTHRYANTDAVQPVIVTSTLARRPAVDPKTDRRRYEMLAHGSHLVDIARHLAGPITEVRARISERFGARCWFVETTFENGTLGHLDLTVAVRMDWHEGFQVYGEHGSVLAKTFNPWFFRTSEVDIFREPDGDSTRVLGADGHFYRRQLEGFADVILNGSPQVGADIEDGVASVRAMAAIARSAETGEAVRLADATGGP